MIVILIEKAMFAALAAAKIENFSVSIAKNALFDKRKYTRRIDLYTN